MKAFKYGMEFMKAVIPLVYGNCNQTAPLTVLRREDGIPSVQPCGNPSYLRIELK